MWKTTVPCLQNLLYLLLTQQLTVGLLPRSQTRASRPVVHFPRPRKNVNKDSSDEPKVDRVLLEESPLPWPGSAHTQEHLCIDAVAISGAGGTWLVPAAPRPGGPAGPALEWSRGRLPPAERPDGAQESAQEPVRGQLRGRHFSTRERRLGRRPNPSDLINVLTNCKPGSSSPHSLSCL